MPYFVEMYETEDILAMSEIKGEYNDQVINANERNLFDDADIELW